MNVKISTDTVVFKISEDELHELAGNAVLVQDVAFTGGSLALKIEAVSGTKESVLSHSQADHCTGLSLQVSPAQIEALSKMGKSRDGLRMTCNGMDVYLQVDVRKDSRQRGTG